MRFRQLFAHLDLRWISALDVRQRAVVELLLQGLSEQDRQLGVVDELGDMSASLLVGVSDSNSPEYRNRQQHDEMRNRRHWCQVLGIAKR